MPPSDTSAAAPRVRPDARDIAFVEMPGGLFSAGGFWFRTTSSEVERYAGAVLEREPLPELVRRAERILRLPQTLAIWTLLGLLLTTSLLWASIGAFVAYVLAAFARPLLAGAWLASVLRALEHPVVQALAYVFVLSLLAQRGAIPAVVTGLAGFIVLRWGLLDRVVGTAIETAAAARYGLPLPDAVLRAVLVRAALRLGVSQPDADALTQSVHRAVAKLPGSGRSR